MNWRRMARRSRLGGRRLVFEPYGREQVLGLPPGKRQWVARRSRLGGRRLVFQPYGREQLKEIVLARLGDADAGDAFNARAIEYAARKVLRPGGAHMG